MHKCLCSYCCWPWISIKEICWLCLTFLKDSKLFPSGNTIHSSSITRRIPVSPVLTPEKVAVCCLDYDYPSGYEVVSWIASICISPVMCDAVHMFAVKLSFLWGNVYPSLLPLSFIFVELYIHGYKHPYKIFSGIFPHTTCLLILLKFLFS